MTAFDFEKAFILENDIALLRPLEANDYQFLLEYAINEPEIWTYSMVRANGPENLANYIQTALQARQDRTEYPFIVFDKRYNTYIGSTRFYDIQLYHKTLQLGYTWYGKAFQGTGINKHCKFLLLQFAFEEMKMERVEFRADARNERSIQAMKSIGCTVEGVLRSHTITYSGERRNSLVLSILAEEWYRDVKEYLNSKLAF
jgi:RimJ/RimL family protein N-acetyltransferase